MSQEKGNHQDNEDHEQVKKSLKKEIELVELEMKRSKADEAKLKLLRTQEKLKETSLNADGKFGTSSEPRKSLASYLRNQNKFEVSAISILDKKAAILIKICPTILSGLIVFQEYIENNVDGGSIVSLILLTGLLITLMLSILSIKPSTRGFDKILQKQIKSLYPNKLENSFYTWEFSTYKDYENAMEKVVNSQDLQLGNQVRANYILGKSNSTIANYLDYAYNTFLITFVLAGVVFILAKYAII